MPCSATKFWIALLFLWNCVPCLPVPAVAAQRTNILFIFVDDMGPGALSCYGNQDVGTPHMDSLSEDGMRFTKAYACSQCSPSRAAFLTGQYGPRSGMTKVINSRSWPHAPMLTPTALKSIPPEVPTIADVLKKAGYVTGLSGKWHVAGPYDTSQNGRQTFDFSEYGFDYAGRMQQEAKSAHCVTGITDDAISFMKENRDKVWFFFASHKTTHTPLNAPSSLVNKHLKRGYPRSTTRWGDFEQRPTADYLAMLEHLDNNVGRMLETLESLGIADDTLVLLMGDNGTLDRVASSTPLRGGKGMPYEGGVRVPLLMRLPGVISPGQPCSSLAHIIDLYPTFASIAGASLPVDHVIDGVSLVSAMSGGSLPRDTLYWHMPHYVPMYARTPCSVIRSGDWKLIHYYGDTFDTSGFTPRNRKPAGKLLVGSRTELYNLTNDPSENTNLIDQHPGKRDELFAKLQDWLDTTSAKLPEPNPDVASDSTKWLYEAPNRLR